MPSNPERVVLELASDPLGHDSQLAQGQNSADVKHISHDYPPWAISANWPRGVNSSGKTSCFGLLASVVAQGVRLPTSCETARAFQWLPFLPTSREGLAGTAGRRKAFGDNGL